jgi:hypothetical protein
MYSLLASGRSPTITAGTGAEDPDPYQNVRDPEHWFLPVSFDVEEMPYRILDVDDI